MIVGYTKPRGIGTNICVAHYRKKEAMCGDNCPFLVECKPFFEALTNAIRCLNLLIEDVKKRS
jgi:hypothetical protein